MKVLRITHALRGILRIIQLAEEEFPVADRVNQQTGEQPVPYCDYSGGYGLGFFHVHLNPHHIF